MRKWYYQEGSCKERGIQVRDKHSQLDIKNAIIAPAGSKVIPLSMGRHTPFRFAISFFAQRNCGL